ncbi:PREDICTED: transmembrane protein C1orf162 homolog [Pygoscelis adeliae]|uniref:transmembrane protein C1orf162 homolog n=1 Tax=Pygoscelis adeliae TaxID=9238 RepID=UPI0004F503AF|nr:PREDICTED: transmembrane protein C1orf162 homolog [Pygoscelis adeliae]
MGSRASKANAVTPEPISTTVTVRTTVYTSAADLRAPEVQYWIDIYEILYISLAFISGILLTVLVFAIIYIIRGKCKRSHQNLQERVPSQTATEESAKDIQNEVAYTTLVFQRSQTLMAV